MLLWANLDTRYIHPSVPYNDFYKSSEDRRVLESRRDWYQLVAHYTMRVLTYESDTLPAMSGLAERISARADAILEADPSSALL